MHLRGCQNPSSKFLVQLFSLNTCGGRGGGVKHVIVELSVFIKYKRQMVCLAA